ncbi:hypothetical protein [Methylobacterium sp. 1030]|uniref:hypothetical protein n=1 Tax=Methylobacterium sp. 1030 TaxID=3156404 RepID=UPI0033965040
MAQRNTVHSITVRVPADTVDLGNGFFLPAGDYPCVATVMHIPMRGREETHLSRAMINLTEEFLVGVVGMPPASGDLLSVEFDVARYLVNGSVKEV